MSTARTLAIGSFCLAVALPVARAQEPPAATAGDEACSTCHEDVSRGFRDNIHARGAAYGVSGAGQACESCHGPGGKHADSQSPQDIRSPKRMEPAAVNELCMTCHARNPAQAFWRGSTHEAEDVACTSCHSMHGGAARTPLLAKADEKEVCLSCHREIRRHLLQRSSHPLREGKMACTSCHSPHGARGEHLIDTVSANDKCYECHSEKRGPYLWEHSPVREDCMSCHTPHGSNHDKLLASQATRLCQSCHLQGRHQTAPGAMNDAWIFNRSCLNCHGQIHGSNHPSGIILQR